MAEFWILGILLAILGLPAVLRGGSGTPRKDRDTDFPFWLF